MGPVTKFQDNPPESRTLARQDELPLLPIPPLEDTLKRYLRALEGLQDRREHEATKRAVEEFLHGDGPRVQEKLREYAKDKARCVLSTLSSPHCSRTRSRPGASCSSAGISYIEEFWCVDLIQSSLRSPRSRV